MNARRRIAAVLAAATVLTGTACAGGSAGHSGPASPAPAQPFPTENVTLTMWWWGEQEAPGAEKWLADTVAAYQAKHPNITIKTVLQTTDGLIPSFEAASAAKQGPDIQYFWGGIYSQQPYWAGATVPVSAYIPAEELAHYTNAAVEDSYGGQTITAPWYVNPQFPVLVRNDVLDKHGVKVPHSWSELMNVCDTLSAQGVTTLAGGVKDGWFGAWLYSMLGVQSVDSKDDVIAAVRGQQSFTDPMHAQWWDRLQESVDHKCWNNDINSLELYQAQQRWVSGDAAMTVTAGTDASNFVDKVGADKVTVMPMPAWGDGPYAGKMATTSQTVGITSWSKYPQVAADFIMFMHTPDRLQAWYDDTGSMPADDRFDVSKVEDPVRRQLFEFVADGAPYLENFIPSSLDSRAVFSGVQLVMQNYMSGTEAAQAMQDEAERLRATDRALAGDFAGWAES
ncbi:raffinose/stachyose/melibiose transport system substrate-binding protein [Mycobacterium frederiksbergense]|uniref:Raffinose/stachyose/melibiose transport system substrate-binding protein n=1 Tax=Mycolicibacterium frederiksbergense TaxID=117567 RepID=A0ABT6KY09_9MYCO|nr:extracellular solute-binding protein [Mycolicibacterium frederiksbergense]MDH6194720.1 raffinose/stachyose/melibiose transport system substrate-binding protein [Mycolicibacterium frederiksbergense]